VDTTSALGALSFRLSSIVVPTEAKKIDHESACSSRKTKNFQEHVEKRRKDGPMISQGAKSQLSWNLHMFTRSAHMYNLEAKKKTCIAPFSQPCGLIRFDDYLSLFVIFGGEQVKYRQSKPQCLESVHSKKSPLKKLGKFKGGRVFFAPVTAIQ
jgi:hypothetical protein